MKKTTTILLAFQLAASISMAQETKHKTAPLLFLSNNLSAVLFPSSTFSLANTAPSRYNLPLTVIDKQVHYTAFFCKLEVKNLERYNIWLKLHAGDYDNYSKPYNDK